LKVLFAVHSKFRESAIDDDAQVLIALNIIETISADTMK